MLPQPLLDGLNAPADVPILFTGIEVIAWGRELRLPGVVDERPFILVLNECRELLWRVYAHVEGADRSRLLSLSLGRDQHRSPLKLLTETFAVQVYYGTWRVERNG